jgi:hypothetical protein
MTIRKSKLVELVYGDNPTYDPLTKMPYSSGIGAPSHARQREQHFEAIEKAQGNAAADKLRAQAKRVPVS